MGILPRLTQILGLRVFALVWFGQLLSWLGSGLTMFALGIWMYQRTGSPTLFAITVLAIAMPRVLLAPLAGPLVDRWDRRLVMIMSDVVAVCVPAALLLLLWHQRLAVWHMYVGIAVNAASGAFQRPAYVASISLLVPKAQYGRANGLLQFARSFADLVAPALAAYLTARFGLVAVLMFDAVTFIIATTILLLVRFPEPPQPRNDAHPPALIRAAWDGWRYVRTRPGLLGLLMYTGAGNVLGITTDVLITPYVLTLTTVGVSGWIVSMIGAGLMVGSLVLSVWGGPRQRVRGIFCFELGVCCCTILIGLTSNPGLIAGAVFGYFVAIALSDGCATALWQTKVDPIFQGRVFALREMVGYAALPLGIFTIAPLAEFVFEPLLQPDGAWATNVGQVLGTGPGKGMALVFILAGIVNMVIVGVAWSHTCIRRVEAELPDALEV